MRDPTGPRSPGDGRALGREPPIWPIETLVGPGREALIRHDDQLYRLRITAQNRLILTK